LVISSLAKRLEVSIFPMYTSFGARPGDHHIVFHSISQLTKYPH
jgi:hypothetical protein